MRFSKPAYRGFVRPCTQITSSLKSWDFIFCWNSCQVKAGITKREQCNLNLNYKLEALNSSIRRFSRGQDKWHFRVGATTFKGGLRRPQSVGPCWLLPPRPVDYSRAAGHSWLEHRLSPTARADHIISALERLLWPRDGDTVYWVCREGLNVVNL